MTKLRKTISQNLSQVRTARGLSQSDLAKSAGLMPSAIAHFESGRRLPSCENLLKLSNALEVSIDELFGKRISNWIATPEAAKISDSIKSMKVRDIQVLADLAALIVSGKRIGVTAGCMSDDSESNPESKTARKHVSKRKQT